MQDWEGPALDAWDAWTPWRQRSVSRTSTCRGASSPGGRSTYSSVSRRASTGTSRSSSSAATSRSARAALAGFGLFTAGSGKVRALQHDEAAPSENHQVWLLDVEAQLWRLDVMLEPGDADTWIFRRDESITAPRSFMVERDVRGVPYLAPHGSLLYKAKAAREKDEADLETCLPRMSAGARAWLRSALEHAHPDHPWIARLT